MLRPGSLALPDPGRLYRYRLIDRFSRPVDLQVYAGLGGLGGSLWEQEVRTLLRLGVPAWPPCPKSWTVATRMPSRPRRQASPPRASRSSPRAGRTIRWRIRARLTRCAPIRSSRSQFQRLAEALAELHALGAQHRNLVPRCRARRLVRARAQVVDSQVSR